MDYFIKKYSLDKRAHFYKFGKNYRYIKLLYGSYDTIKDAKDAMAKLDKKLLSYGAYVDNMKKHYK